MSHPVSELRKQTLALRASLKDCLAKPRPNQVHNIRTATRRVEAELELFPLLGDAPTIASQSKRFLKAAKRIRQAAGKVRDLDVHTDRVAEFPKTADSKTLAKALTRKRKRESDKLQRTLHKHEHKLLAVLADLEAALLPARSLSLSGTQADQIARRWFDTSASHLDPEDPAQFHELRKAAKLARYIAETASPSSPTARHFNRIQQTTGDWHDWLTLTDFACKHLPPSSPLLTILKQHRDQAHRTALIAARSIKSPRKTRTAA